MNMTQSNNDKIQESISIIQRTLNPVSSDNTKIQYPLNRIVFGANYCLLCDGQCLNCRLLF